MGWLIGIVALVILLLGAILASKEAAAAGVPSGASTPQDACGGCKIANKWWNSLPIWKKILYVLWWLTKFIQCTGNGCSPPWPPL